MQSFWVFVLLRHAHDASVHALANLMNTNGASLESTARGLQNNYPATTQQGDEEYQTDEAQVQYASDEDQAGSGCNGQQFQALDGELLSTIHVSGMQESQLDDACCEKCKETTGCEFWVRHRGIGDHECYLKKNPTDYHTDDYMRGGWTPANPLKARFSDIEGRVVDELTIVGSTDHNIDAQCALRCAATPECEFWVREKGQNGAKLCWLKRDPVKHVDDGIKRGGWKPPPEALPHSDARFTYKPTEPPPFTTGAPMTAHNPNGRAPENALRDNIHPGTADWHTVVDPMSGKTYMQRSLAATATADTHQEWHETQRAEDLKAGKMHQSVDSDGHISYEHHYYNPQNPYTSQSSSLLSTLQNATISNIHSYVTQQWEKLTFHGQDDTNSVHNQAPKARSVPDYVVRREPN